MDTTSSPPPGPSGPYRPPAGSSAGSPPPGGPPPGGPPPGGPPPGSPPPGRPTPDGGGAFFDSVRRSGLVRSDERWIGGVAGGIAYRLRVDPLVVRGAFIVLALFGGLAVIVYGVAWALLPEAADGRIHLQEALRGRFDAALAGAVALVLIGLAEPVSWLDAHRWLPGWLLGLAWVGVLVTVIVLALTMASRSTRGGGTYPSVVPPSSSPNWSSEMKAPAPGAPAPYPSSGTNATAPHPTTYGPAGGQGGEPYANATYAAPPPSSEPPGTPVWQQPPPRSVPPGPGSVTVAVVLAITFFTGAGILLAHRAGYLAGNALLTFAGLALVVLGLGALLSGLRGRRAGALAGIAVLIAVLAVPAAVVGTVLPDWRRTVGDSAVMIGDAVWAPATVAEAEEGFSFGIGDARVDLTGPDWQAEVGGGPTNVSIESGAGSTTVVVPADVPLEIRAHVGAGEIRSTVSSGWDRTVAWGTRDRTPSERRVTTDQRTGVSEAQGTDVRVVMTSPAAAGRTTDELALVVTIDAGIGDVTIEEDAR